MKDQITYNGKKYKRVDESLDRRVTVKEVRSWLKKLEEFRYRKIRNVDARRVTSFINSNLSETDLPNSLQKQNQTNHQFHLEHDFEQTQQYQQVVLQLQ